MALNAIFLFLSFFRCERECEKRRWKEREQWVKSSSCFGLIWPIGNYRKFAMESTWNDSLKWSFWQLFQLIDIRMSRKLSYHFVIIFEAFQTNKCVNFYKFQILNSTSIIHCAHHKSHPLIFFSYIFLCLVSFLVGWFLTERTSEQTRATKNAIQHWIVCCFNPPYFHICSALTKNIISNHRL